MKRADILHTKGRSRYSDSHKTSPTGDLHRSTISESFAITFTFQDKIQKICGPSTNHSGQMEKNHPSPRFGTPENSPGSHFSSKKLYLLGGKSVGRVVFLGAPAIRHWQILEAVVRGDHLKNLWQANSEDFVI